MFNVIPIRQANGPSAYPNNRASTLQDSLLCVGLPARNSFVIYSNAKIKSGDLARNQLAFLDPTGATQPAYGQLNGIALPPAALLNGTSQFIGGTNNATDAPILRQISECSVLAVCIPTNVAPGAKARAFSIADTVGGVNELGLGITPAGGIEFAAFDTVGGSQNPTAAQGNLAANRVAVLIGRRSASLNVHEAYCNGIPNSSNTTYTALGNFPAADDKMAIGAWPTAPANFFPGSVHFIAVWDRALLPWEIAAISQNPFAVLGNAPSLALVSSMADAIPAGPYAPYDLAHTPQHQAQMAS